MQQSIQKKYDPLFMLAIRSGDENSFFELYQDLQPSLLLFAYRLVQDQAVAQDLVQEGFIKIWNKRILFQEFKALKVYLYKTVRNDSLNWLNHHAKRIPTMVGTVNLEDYTASDISKHLVEAEIFRFVKEALEALPTQTRRILQMTYFDNLDSNQIGKALGTSASTIRTLKMRGLKTLKNKIRKSGLLCLALLSCYSM